MKRLFLLILLITTFSAGYAQTWKAAGTAPENCLITNLYIDPVEKKLYGIGNFITHFDQVLGQRAMLKIMVLTDGQWQSVTEKSVYGRPYALCIYKKEIYIAGSFIEKKDDTGILKWNGTDWVPIGERLYPAASFTAYPMPTVFALAVYNDKLFIAGDFASKDEKNYHLASWDGTNLNFFDNSKEERVTFLKVAGGNLYAGTVIKSTAQLIKLNGDKWDPIGKEIRVSGASNGMLLDAIEDLVLYKDTIYICGDFTKQQNILKLGNDSSWVTALPIKEHSFGGYSSLYALEECNGHLIMTGFFEWGEKPQKDNTIGVWDGERWLSYNPIMKIKNVTPLAFWGLNAYSLAVLDNKVYWSGIHSSEDKKWNKEHKQAVLELELPKK